MILALLGTLAAFPAVGRATVPDLYGIGARSSGMGGGGVAYVDDGPAAMINPAGLSRTEHPSLGVAFSAAIEQFEPVPALWWDTNRDGALNEADPPLQYDVGVENPAGMHLFLGRNIGSKFGVGLAAYVPANRLLRLATFEPSLPTYFMYANRPHRYALAVGVGGEVIEGLHLGASVDFVPRARLKLLMTADATITGDPEGDGAGDLLGGVVLDVHQLTLDILPGFAPIFGVQAELGKWIPALDGVVLGASFRGSVGLPIEVILDAQVNAAITDVGDLDPFVTALVLDAGLSIYDHYVPLTVAGSVAMRKPRWGAYADLRWTRWRSMVLNVARIEYLTVDAPLVDVPDDAVSDGNQFEVSFASVFSVRTGGEWLVARREVEGPFRYWEWRVRAGAGYEPTPLVDQRDSALLDADRLLFTVGAGVETFDPFSLIHKPIRLDVFGQYHQLLGWRLPRTADAPTAGYPREGDAFDIGGRIFQFGAQISFSYL